MDAFAGALLERAAPAAATEYSPSDSKRGQILGVLIATTTVAYISYAMRMYVRIRIVKWSLGWDDWTMTLSIIFCTVTLITECLAIAAGMGTHKVFLPPDKVIEAAKWSTLSITPNLLSINIARISLCLMLLRLVGENTYHRAFLYFIILGTVCFASTSCVSTYITCIPTEKVWDQSLPGACDLVRRGNIGVVVASWTVAADWLVALFPLVMLRKLQMAFKTKLALAFLMGMGFFLGILVLLKLLKIGSLFSRTDPTYDSADMATWAIIEANIGILLVNIPTIRPLFSRVFALTRKGTGGEKPSGSHSQYGNLDGYNWNLRDLGRSKGSHVHNVTITTRTGRSPLEDDMKDNESESSLVVKEGGIGLGMGITKTVGFEQTSYSHHASKDEKRMDRSMV